MSKSILSHVVNYDKAYPEIRKYTDTGKIDTLTVKMFLYDNGLLDASQLADKKLDYQPIAWALYKAFSMGILSLNATKQKGILNKTVIRMSTSLGGKMKNVWAFSTLSLVNPLCLKRMQNDELVCAH